MADMAEEKNIPTEGADNADQSGENKEKMFTQEEVNKIVKSRLSRDRDTRSNQELREQTLRDREQSLLVREALLDRGMPRELSDIIKFSDEKDLISKLDILDKLLNSNKKEESDSQAKGFRQIGVGRNDGSVSGTDPVRKAMGLK